MLRLEQAHHALRCLRNIREGEARRGDGVQTDHLRRGINAQTFVLFECDRGRALLAIALILNSNIVLTGSLADGIVDIHPSGT